MSSPKYPAIKVQQQPGAPNFYVTAVPARDLLNWCDVPRAKGDYMAGYQRALDDRRTSALTKYISQAPENIVPGAVIVSVDADHLSVSESGGTTELTVTEDTRDFRTKLEELFGGFTTRLSDGELKSADIQFSSTDEDEEQDEEQDEAQDADEAQEPTSYLAALAAELKTAITDWDRVPPARQQAIREYISGAFKPGLIIDGQHRVFGAADVDHEVVLPVVVIPGLAASEQVFQFYVLNSKARPLKPTELRRIVSTTLSNQEIAKLYLRFKQAGVTPEEARWTYEMNTRWESPFFGLIDFGLKQPGVIIPENVAAQLVKRFMKLPLSRYRQLTEPLGELWADYDSRLNIFFWFWNAIKSAYSEEWSNAEALAKQGMQHNLFLKVTLLVLQRFVLEKLLIALRFRPDDSAHPLSSQETVREIVASTLSTLPAQFFSKEWKMKQLDTSEGRKDLEKFMDKVWNDKGKLSGNMKLFKGD